LPSLSAGQAFAAAADPLMINASGSFSVIPDFQPTQNYSGEAHTGVV
jgi:hypothetical protein